MPSVRSGGRALGLLVALALSVACAGDDDTTTGPTPTVVASAVGTDDLDSTDVDAGRAVLPADLPAAPLPLPPSGLRSASGAAPGPWILIYGVEGDASEALSAFRDRLVAAGFDVQDAADAGALASSVSAVGHGLDVTTIASGAGDGAGMVITVTSTP